MMVQNCCLKVRDIELIGLILVLNVFCAAFRNLFVEEGFFRAGQPNGGNVAIVFSRIFFGLD